MHKYFLIYFLLLFFSSYIYAQQNTATITGFTFTADDSALVIDHLVRLKDAQGIQIDSVYTGNSNQWQFFDIPTPVIEEKNEIPNSISLYQNYPNPFNPHTTIRYEINTAMQVKIDVFDIKGELIKVLVDKDQESGVHEIIWDATNIYGKQVAEGIYLLRMIAGKNLLVKKMIFLHKTVKQFYRAVLPKNNNFTHSLSKKQSVDYLIEVVNLAGTNPQIINTEFLITISGDTTLNLYAPREGSQYADIDLTSLVEMLSGFVPGKYETVQLKQNGNVIQTKNTGGDGNVLFENVPKDQNYTIQIIGNTASRPNINPEDTLLFIDKDTAVVVNPELYLRPAVLDNLENKAFNEDEFPANPRIHDLWTKATGYDSLGNEVNPNQLMYVVQSQSNPDLAPVIIEANQYTRLDSLLSNGNGTNNVTVRAFPPNGVYADAGFNVIVNPMTDISGVVDSLFGNEGHIEGVNVKYRNKTTTTNGDGNYHLQVAPSSNLDTLVFTKNGFYQRRLSPFAPTGDTTVDGNKVDTSLNMDFVNETSRFIQPGTERWTSQPVWYININPPAGGGTITQEMIDTAIAIIQNDLVQFTDNYFQNPVIEIGTNPPAYGTPGYVRVEWDNTIPGAGAHGEYTNGNEIYSAYAKFLTTPNSRRAKLQELSQNLGPRNDSNIVPSIFNTAPPSDFYLPVDLKLGKFLYNRAPGNLSPDTDQ